jgi:poly(hydroxyalkanoate) granule-associated protein
MYMDDEETRTEGTDHTEPWADSIPSEILGPIEAAKRLALASLGAVSLATEMTDELFQQLVKRGEHTKEEVARELHEARERSSTRREDATTYVRSRMDAILNRVNMPSKADVDSINAKLNILTRKIDEVQAGQVDRASTQRASSPEPPTDFGST